MNDIRNIFRFDRVRLWIQRPNGVEFNGAVGVVVWCDHTASETGPFYIVEVDAARSVCGSTSRYITCVLNEVEPIGARSSEEHHTANRNEISFDVDDGREGCLRTPGKFWEAYFIMEGPGTNSSVVRSEWHSGIMGNLFSVPIGTQMSESLILSLMAQFIDCNEWTVVNGPDSLILK